MSDCISAVQETGLSVGRAVSYTHLDVYKRQILLRVGELGLGVEGVRTVGDVEKVVQTDGHTPGPEAPEPGQHQDDAGLHLRAVHVHTCLLYTSHTFSSIADIEKTHGDRFGRFADLLEQGKLFVSDVECKWRCV